MKKYNHAEGDYDSSCGCSHAEGSQSTAFSKNDYISYNGICNHHYLKDIISVHCIYCKDDKCYFNGNCQYKNRLESEK